MICPNELIHKYGIITTGLEIPEDSVLLKSLLSTAIARISVTDFYNPEFNSHIPYHWFPIVELSNWGTTPFYWFWKTLELYYGKGHIHVHCSGGVNRSRSMVYSWLYFRKKLPDSEIQKLLGRDIVDLWEKNQKRGHIPMHSKLEQLSFQMTKHDKFSLSGLLNMSMG